MSFIDEYIAMISFSAIIIDILEIRTLKHSIYIVIFPLHCNVEKKKKTK